MATTHEPDVLARAIERRLRETEDKLRRQKDTDGQTATTPSASTSSTRSPYFSNGSSAPASSVISLGSSLDSIGSVGFGPASSSTTPPRVIERKDSPPRSEAADTYLPSSGRFQSRKYDVGAEAGKAYLQEKPQANSKAGDGGPQSTLRTKVARGELRPKAPDLTQKVSELRPASPELRSPSRPEVMPTPPVFPPSPTQELRREENRMPTQDTEKPHQVDAPATSGSISSVTGRLLRSKSAGPHRLRDTNKKPSAEAKSSAVGTASQSTIVHICDKCDGPHATKDCPHFKKARSKHADAWSAYGRSKSAPASMRGDEPAVIIKYARIVPQPGDGSCLFHSLCFGLQDNSSAMQLRKDIAGYIATHPGLKIADTAIKDWVKYDSGGNVRAYASKMKSGTWGGGIEMAALTKMRNVNVHVYEKCKEGFKRISAFENQGAKKTVNVLYRGRMHYDALVISPSYD